MSTQLTFLKKFNLIQFIVIFTILFFLNHCAKDLYKPIDNNIAINAKKYDQKINTLKESLIHYNDSVQTKVKEIKLSIKNNEGKYIGFSSSGNNSNDFIANLAQNIDYNKIIVSIDFGDFVGLNINIFKDINNGYKVRLISMNNLDTHKIYFVEYKPDFKHFLRGKDEYDSFYW